MTDEELDRTARLLAAFNREYSSRSHTFMPVDSLTECFALQRGFMAMLREDGRFPDWPLDLSSKENQRKLQTFLWDTVREIAEASATLKNRPHRVQEEGFDRAHFLEEMGDALAFFMEVLILAGFTEDDIVDEYKRKNLIVRHALIEKER